MSAGDTSATGRPRDAGQRAEAKGVVVTFGEIMMRVEPPGFLRLRQALPGSVEVTFAGAEASVAASLALFGRPARFVTALPGHEVASACVASLRAVGVDTGFIRRTDEGRLGIYFVETGANQRPSTVLYDRDGASVALTGGREYDWAGAFTGASWLHVSGITPSLSEKAAEATLTAVRAANEAGLTVSCDLNFRNKLWRWKPGVPARALAGETMRNILPYVHLLIGNEEDASDVLGIQAEGSDIHAGRLAVERYPDVARRIVEQFPNIMRVATTLRESVSATHNNWGAMLYLTAEDRAYFAPERGGTYTPYEIRNIIDRIGGGDAFAAALIYALLTPELSMPPSAVSFAAAASCLAHSIKGDFNFVNRAEVESLMKGSGSGRVVR